MSVAFKVASSSGRVKVGTHPYGRGGSVYIPLPNLTIYGCWPRYRTIYKKWGEESEVFFHWGRKALNAYIVTKRLEDKFEITDKRFWWK